MRCLIAFVLLTLVSKSGYEQTVINKYPTVLWSANDSFSIRFSNFPAFETFFKISSKDSINYGGDGATELYATIYLGKDSLLFYYKNLPYRQEHWITFQSPKGKCLFKLHFNEVNAAFSKEYIQKNKGTVQIQIPEVYELANVIWTLSPIGEKAKGLNKQGKYYQNVVNYFKPYLSHPLFKQLDFADSAYLKNYYDFRENSFAFSFKNDKIVYEGPYYYVTGDRNYNNLFTQLLPLIEDFAEKTHFISFYKNNSKYYKELEDRQEDLMPIKRIWSWLENQFPNKYDAYKIVFSPLIGTSHSTQIFRTFVDSKWFQEPVMFVSAPPFYDTTKGATENLRQGLASGIVFTEIDHNYINPVSNKYIKQIDSIFSKREIWASGGDTKFYASPESIFNEYMTHAVFCLFVLDNYDTETAQVIIKKREDLMVNRRQYLKFKEFNKALIELYSLKKTRITDLYPLLLQWCKTQN
jgi:hypothetical protein